MSNINQTQDLFTLDTVQDLDDKTAATCSGGRGYLYGSDPDVILYQDSDQKGYSLGVNAATGDGISNIGYRLEPPVLAFFDLWNKTNFNDLTSSVTIKRGSWQLYEDENYSGSSSILGPGTYNIEGNLNDKITSLKRVGA